MWMELTADELWSRILDAARSRLPEQGFQTWVAGATVLGLSGDELLLEAPSEFHVQWLEDKYGDTLADVARQVVGRPVRISARARSGGPTTVPTVELTPPSSILEAHQGSVDPSPRTLQHRPLNERYTFDRFVVGTGNQLAVAGARAVAERPARLYNPLFLYGGVGLGKTHLMHAIGNHIVENHHATAVAYVPSEQFTNELVTAIQEGKTADFRRRYRQMDLLLVDDVHFLEGKERTQEEFFHTFNALHDAHRQIVLTSDRPPKDIPGLEERLVSRFEWGLVADEGAVIKLLAYSSLKNEEITLELARTSIRAVLKRGEPGGPPLTPELIREATAERWGVDPTALTSKRRTKDLTVPRQVAMYLIKEILGTPLVQIGRHFGGRDHSTVHHSIQKVEKQLETDDDFRLRVEAVAATLREGV
jgi:chromosomal replication initiator protein